MSALSSVIVWRVMQPQAFGVYALAESFYALWTTLDLTGVGAAFNTRVGIAIGQRNQSAILDLMAMSVKISLMMGIFLLSLVIIFGGAIAERLHGSALIGQLATGLGLAAIADGQYSLFMNSLSARRYMRSVAVMSNVNQILLTVTTIGAALIQQTPESLLIGRLIYSYSTLGLAWWMYRASRAYELRQTESKFLFPSIGEVYRRVFSVPIHGHWRFGFANALDKNLGALFIQIPMQIVGSVGGASAASYLSLAHSGIIQGGVLGAAIFENMQAVIPQAVGRGDFVALRRNFLRVIVVLSIGGLALYGAMALVAPFLIPPILGAKWSGAIAPLIVLSIYGAITTAGGVFGPLYRAFNRMGIALLSKLIALLIMLPIGLRLIDILSQTATLNNFWGAGQRVHDTLEANGAAIGGAWMINGLFFISVGITGVMMLRELHHRSKTETMILN